MDIASFEMYLKEHIKVDNKLNNLGEVVAVSSSDEKLSVVASCAFSKRYLKYLTKKYLKKQQIRDYLRVIASGKNGYKLTYFSLAKEE
ncbi:ribosomal protein L22 [Blastocystis sp. subtype 4]|uniref:ribosomal protein L22 n=1 Tax=Blastocystis sp. subtype 4 TaxID=944170 RepID=UPI0007113F91|nr:ribosomal protein L22 [Blastocystis sp. subtype 4]KNB45062.1 ribosomal protein L22 [Blastocystis sp. subtype 4]|eukprot:XP_014528505.1 ribosomal protein L22 [Blastocystis sp. subtype 4]